MSVTLTDPLAAVLRALLRYSFNEIGDQYAKLTDGEQAIISRAMWRQLLVFSHGEDVQPAPAVDTSASPHDIGATINAMTESDEWQTLRNMCSPDIEASAHVNVAHALLRQAAAHLNLADLAYSSALAACKGIR